MHLAHSSFEVSNCLRALIETSYVAGINRGRSFTHKPFPFLKYLRLILKRVVHVPEAVKLWRQLTSPYSTRPRYCIGNRRAYFSGWGNFNFVWIPCFCVVMRVPWDVDVWPANKRNETAWRRPGCVQYWHVQRSPKEKYGFEVVSDKLPEVDKSPAFMNVVFQ